jgi:hypothetical protein
MVHSECTSRMLSLRLMRRLYGFAFTWLLASNLICANFAMAQTEAKPNSAPRKTTNTAGPALTATKPSLDALVGRVTAYWTLLRHGEKSKAMEYVEVSCRRYFQGVSFPSFSDPVISKLEFKTPGKEMAVTVIVRRVIPGLPSEINFPVMNRWVFAKGYWWVIIENDAIQAFLSGNSTVNAAIRAAELEKKKAGIRSRLVFIKKEIELGTVRKGPPAEFELEYKLQGDRPMQMGLKDASLFVVRFPMKTLSPGVGRIPMTLMTSEYDGAIQGSFTIFVIYDEVEVNYDFTLKGRVYTPLSISPPVLRYLPDETEKTLEITNNSPVAARLTSASSRSGNYRVTSLPQTLAPGDHISLKVELLSKDVPANNAELLTIELAAPVDGMSDIHLPVMANVEAQKGK